MHWKQVALAVMAFLFVIVAVPARSQVAPPASSRGLPLTVGAGVSDYYLDWGPSRYETGITAWADWRPLRMPRLLDGLGIELEGRSIFFNSSVAGHRMDTGAGGVIYEWRRYDRVRPYAKYLIGLGSIDFPPPSPQTSPYTHDTRTILAPGAGADFRVWRSVSVRADYEYQFWRQLFGPHDLNPNGVTLGAVYDFGRRE